MTLDTRIIIQAPTAAREVFDFCRSLIGATEETQWKANEVGKYSWSLNPGWWNHPEE